MDHRKKPNTLIISMLVLVLLSAATVGTLNADKDETTANIIDTATQSSTPADTATTNTTTPQAADTTNDQNSAPTSALSSTYKDGTYTTTSSYSTPDGRESIGVTLTLTNDTITSVSVSQNAQSRDSEFYQQEFAASYQKSVIGKAIESLTLSRISGASLTTNGFNNALEIIKNDAAI